MDLSILSGPIIGAVIGYGTNWIAIKMLFRPLKPIKIGKFVLPFTPGIIPKRKEKIANAIGQMVGKSLFTTEDLKAMLLTENVQEEFVASIYEKLENEKPIKELLYSTVDEEIYFNTRKSLELVITEKIKDGLIKAKIGEIIATEGAKIVKDKVSGSMLKMFVTDGLIDSIVTPMGAEVEKYIKEHGQERILPEVDSEIVLAENSTIYELIQNFNLREETLKTVIREIYKSFISNNASVLLQKVDISKVVEDKINQMEVLELEKLLLSIMKKELSAIVNLGAIIGLALGTLNIFI